MTNRPIKIGDFLLRKKDIITVQDGEKYRRITIRMNKLGVLQRDEVMGVEIGTKKQYVVQGGEFILSKIDSRNGAFGIVPASLKGAIITGDFLAYDINTELVDIDFFLAFISLNNFEKICAQASSGTTNRQRLNEPKFLNFEIQIPETIGGQKEMMKKYFEYKKGFSELKNISDKNEKLIKSLRSSILQDAIEGKLVSQDPTDEPASILMEKIQVEKTKLIAEGKIKKQKPLTPIKPEEIPYELPKGWEWVRFGDLGYLTGGGTPSMSNSEYWGGNIPWISPKDMKFDIISDSEMKITELGILNSSANLIKTGAILMVARSGILVRHFPVAINQIDCTVNQDLKVLIPHITELNRYIQLMLNASGQRILRSLVKYGTTVHSLKYEEFSLALFPLPPLQEQNRIVEKIDELMRSCELLDEQIKQARERSEKLMESVLQGVFNS